MADADNNEHNVAGNRTINIGSGLANFITAMTAAVVEEFSFIFVAFITPNGENVIIGVSAIIFEFISAQSLSNNTFSLMLKEVLSIWLKVMVLVGEL